MYEIKLIIEKTKRKRIQLLLARVGKKNTLIRLKTRRIKTLIQSKIFLRCTFCFFEIFKKGRRRQGVVFFSLFRFGTIRKVKFDRRETKDKFSFPIFNP